MSDMKVIGVNRLGVAAYIAMHDCPVQKVENGVFYMQTDRSLESWEMEYLNSCCQKHDSMLIQLRKLIRN